MHALIPMAVKKTDLEVRPWMSNYIPQKVIILIIHPCPTLSETLPCWKKHQRIGVMIRLLGARILILNFTNYDIPHEVLQEK